MTSKLLQMITTLMPFFCKNYLTKFTAEFSHFLVAKKVFFCHQKVTKFCSKFFLGNFCKKMSSPWWSCICKRFDVIKSYIILSVDCNTNLHTLNKKQKHFWMLTVSLSAKTKGGRSSSGGKTHFWEQTEICGHWCSLRT